MSAGPVTEPVTGEIVVGDQRHGPTGIKERLAGRAANIKEGRAGREWTVTLHGALWIGGLDLGLVVLLVQCLGLGVTSISLPGIGIITFLGILVLSHRSGHPGFKKVEMRCAIAATFMVVYFTMLGVLLFSNIGLSPVARTLINNFTYLVGAVIAFYFGSTAVVDHATAKYRHTSGEGSNNKAPSPSR
jgi:hypothetical protein